MPGSRAPVAVKFSVDRLAPAAIGRCMQSRYRRDPSSQKLGFWNRDRLPVFQVALCFKSALFVRKKLLSGHHLRDRVIQLRHAVTHVADSLLKNEFRVFSLLDYPSEEGAHGALHSCPKSHYLSSSASEV